MRSPTTGAAVIEGGSPTIFVSDLNQAIRFYVEVLGLRIRYQAGEHFAMIDAGGGLSIGLHPPGRHTPPPGAEGGIQIGFNVAGSIEDAVEELEARGVVFEERGGRAVIDDGAVKLAFFGDPDGNSLYLCEVVKHATER
jgi:catechol 2,3-dioxygenase-like lactoylglutathione lyase family enzyme